MPLESLDGRRAVRDRNRNAVVDAVLDLIGEGHDRPTADAVAERSGISVRSVFRYFDDLDGMLELALLRQAERARPLYAPLDPTGDRAARIQRFVRHRLRQHDELIPYARLAIRLASVNPSVAQELSARRLLGRGQIEALFAPELDRLLARDRREVVDALEASTQIESLELLLVERHRTRAAVLRILTRTVDRLLPQP